MSVGGQNYTYDANGNILSTGTGVGTNAYSWDAEGHMVSDAPSGSNAIGVKYDALGRAVETSSGGSYTQFVYSPLGDKLGVMSGQTLGYGRVGLPGGGLVVYNAGPVLARYWHADWQGTMRLLSNPDRTFYHSAGYAPYGEIYASSANPFVPDFAGLLGDTASEVYDAEFRRYNPTQGRWLSPDPAGLAAADPTNPRSWNRYAYALNNPTTLVDPKGLCSPGQQNCNHPPSCTNMDCASQFYCHSMYCGFTSSDTQTCTIDGVSAPCGMINWDADALCPYGYTASNALGMPVQCHAISTGAYYSCALQGTYGSQNAAATAAEGCILGGSIATNTEFSGNVYKMGNGQYSFTEPTPGGPAWSPFDPSDIPGGTEYAGAYHTHGAYDPNYENEIFSPADTYIYQRLGQGQPGYVGTPAGRVEVFYPNQGTPLPLGCVLLGPAAPAGLYPGSAAVPQCP